MSHLSVVPVNGVMGLRSFNDFRAWAYGAVPVISAVLVGTGVYTDEVAPLWIGLVLAILNPVVQFRNTDSRRKWVYGVLGAINLVLIAYGIVDVGAVDMWLPLVTLIIGAPLSGNIAAQNVVTTNDYDQAA